MIEVDVDDRLGEFELAVKFALDAPVVGLFGRSGSGKTSVINAIAGIRKPARGLIRVNDATLFDSQHGINLAPEQRRVGFVFQDALLFPHLNVRANLLYGQHRRPVSERVFDEARIVDLLGLAPFLSRKPKSLSGGEKQRVAIGRALLAQPRILLMDEPLAALDVPRKAEILDYIERVRDELAIPIVYVTHSVAEITRLADSVVLLADGKSIAAGDVDEVMGRADLKPATGRYEAGTLIETHVLGQDPAQQITTLGFDGGQLLIPHVDVAIGERVRVRIRARDVSIAVHRPEGISILNILPGTIAAIEEGLGPVVDVQIAAGSAMLVSRITRHSVTTLGLHPGQEVFALVKAVSFDQRSVGFL